MKRILLLFLMLSGMLGIESLIAQITPNGNSGQSTTAYTNGAPNDNIYIWCGYGIGTNTASLTATPPSGTGPWTFRWYFHNQATASWAVHSVANGATSTISNLPSDGYRVEIFDAGNNLVGCYTAWVWNMNANITAAAATTSCNSANLTGTLAAEGTFSYYNPPPPESLINATTNISVCFSANHTYLSDLAFYLVGPAACGSPVILLTPNPQTFAPNPGNCNGGDNVNNVCFSNTTLNRLNVCTAGAPLTGTYGAYGLNAPGTAINWAPLIGCNAAAGGWRVQIYDCIGQDVGALTSANISFSNLTSRCGSPTTINYASGAINSAINDNSCTAATASIFQVPPAVNLTTPITINATTTYLWTASPATAIPNASTSLTPSVTGIPQGTTTFTLTGTVTYGGTTCTYTASTAAFTNTCCTATANAGTDVTFCSGGGSAVIGTPAVVGRTYSWSPATGLSDATAAQPTVTLNNATGAPQTTVYTLTVTNVADGGCTATDAVNVTVRPLPVVTATPALQTICSGATTGIALTSVPAGATFAWTVAQTGVTGASAGNGTSIAQTLTASGSVAGTATYTITPTLATCPGAPIDVVITVNPNPVVTATPTAQTICSGETTGIALTSVPAGATFAWTISQTGASGASNGNGNTIAQTLTANGATPGTVTYTIVPTIGTCVGQPVDVTITVNPRPVVTATPALQTICSGTSTGIALTSVPAGATFAWTVVESGTSGATAGNGNTIAQTLAVTGLVAGTTTYTVTPTIGTCVGTPINVPITVNPTPTAIATPTAETICSGATTGIALTSSPAGSTFAWTVAQTGVSGASAGNGTSIAQTLTATGIVAGTATYTITPTLGTCPGTPIVVVITVNPLPVVTATPALQTICSGTSTGIALTSVPAGATYAWTVTQTGVSGASAGNGASIAQVLTTTGAAVGTATYTITPTIGTCVGLPINVTITVNPIPTAVATPTAQTICSGATTGIALTSVPAGSTFAWTVAQTGVSGASAGNGTSIAQTLTATGIVPGTATYTITPTLATCPGAPIDVVITVNPLPVVTATPALQTICSGTATGIALTSVPVGATYAWTVTQTGASGASAGNGASIAQTLTATGATAGTVTYTITPTIGTCVGLPVNVVITVNPTPVVTATPALQTICSGTATGIALTSVPAGATFAWTVAESGTSGATAGSGNTIAQTLSVTGLVAGTTTYTVTPTIGTCVGSPIDVVITVNPTPTAIATPTAQTICSGTATGIALTSSPVGSTFAWTVAQTGVSGASAGNGNSIAQTLTATGTVQGTATYTITPTLGTCIGAPITVVISVDPTPVAVATPTAQTICSGTSTGIALTSVPAGSTFAWTVTQTGITGAADGSGNSIAQTLTSTGTAVGTATYTITPTLTGCPGLPIDVIITVNPIPAAIATPALQTICSGATTGIALTSTPAGSTFAWTVVEAGTSGASAGNGNSIGQTLTATGIVPGTATYTITPTLAGCVGAPIDVVITVNPNPVVTATPAAQTICSGTSTGIALTSVPVGATYAWTVTQTGASGASAGTGNSIAQTLAATGATAGTVTYTITPTIGTCVGVPVDVVITVNPTPVVTATPALQTICSGTATGIALSSVPAGATFAWTVAESGTSGATAGSGTNITQTLSVTGLVAGTTTYTVTPTIGTCVGSPIDVVISVSPTPNVTATPALQTICSGTATGIALTSSPTGSTFAWTVTQTGVSGASAGNGNSIAQTLTATGTVQGTATYTITPTLGTCIGAPITVVISVDPTPVAVATPTAQTICSGTSTGIALTTTPPGGTFAWTVTQTGITGATAGSGNNIAQTLTSTGIAVGTATYTITPTLTGCPGLPIDVIITVNPIPAAIATPALQTICSGATTGIALTSTPAGSTFAWTVVESGTSGATVGNGASIAQVLNATGIVPGTATYSVTPTLAGCVGSPIDVAITVNPNPVVTATPAAQTICSGTATGIALTSVPVGATYAWTVTQTGASGASAGTGNSIAQTLAATGATAGTVTYTITPTIGTCVGVPVNVVITVNPTPVASATPALQTICSGTSTGIALTSVPAGATFAWTVAESGTSGATAGSGANIAQTLSVTGLVQGTTTYTVTPTIGVCVGAPIIVPITVNPTPTAIATPTAQTICSGTSTGIALTSSPVGSTFAWTVAQTGVTGASAGSGNSIAQILNATGVQGTATYTITPTLGACVGAPITVVITINQTPVAIATPTAQTICSGTATGIALTTTPPGGSFAWTVAQTGVSGATAGNGNSIAQTLTSTGTAVGTATYTIIPTLVGCPGLPIDVIITVNPIPTTVPTPTAQTICSGATTGIALTSVPTGSTFAWTVAQTGVSGATAGNGASIAQVLNTTSSLQGTATYSITPTLAGCVGSPVDVIITVNPNPVVTATPTAQTICSGETTAIALSSVPTGATYAWTVAQTGASGASAGSGASIAQVLSATGIVPGTVTYTITPTIGTCVGVPVNVTITINPLPVATATPALQTICSGTTTGIALTSSPVGATYAWTVAESGTSGATAGNGATIAQVLSVTGLVQGTTTYTVTPTIGVCVGSPINIPITVNPTPTAIATPTAQTICSGATTGIALTSSPTGSTYAWTVAQSGVSGATGGTGASIAQLLTTTGTVQGTATYTITPTLGACVGAPITVVITVNPTPVVVATPSIQTICSGVTTGIALSSTPTGSTYAWTVNQVGATGATAGTGNTIAQTLTSTGTAVGMVTYHVTPTLGVCAGLPIDVIITVNPLPTVVATPASQAICTGLSTGIALTSAPTGSTFTWTTSQTGVSGATNGTGNSIAQVLTSANGGTATYAVTPSLNGCVGPVSNIIITVNPRPVLTPTPALTSICAGSSVPLSVAGAATYAWSPATGLSATTGSTVNASPTTTQAYTIQGTDINGCIGTANINVTVNPIPVTVASANDTICLGGSVNLTVSGATTYSWTPGTALSATTGNAVTANPTTTTTYTVTGTSLNCSSTATVQVYVKPLPVVSAGADITVCNGQSVTLFGSGANTYLWTGGVNNNVPFTPSVTTTYTVVGTALNQCTATDDVTVTVINAPVIAVIPSTAAGCAPVNVTFQNNTTGAVSYTWDFGDGHTSTAASPYNTYMSIGCFDVTMTASTAEGCTATAVFPSVVCVEPSPTAAFLMSPTRVTLDNPVSSMINLSENATSYSWTFGDGLGGSTEFNPTHTFPSHSITNYEVILVAYSASGCTDTARAHIETYEDIVYFVPNTFTPDNDDYNQTFQPVFASGFDPYSFTMLIYDRWGQVIFESHDASIGWSGTYGAGHDVVQDGTYVWTIEFKVTQTGERRKIEGHVNVLR